MTDPKHERLRSLFDRALDLPPAERAAFLARECGGDSTLKLRVEALLTAADDDRFLASPTSGRSPDVAENSALLAERPGTRIGPYKLLEQIGEGGFGVVFMAEQETPVTRRVALKIIKLGMDTRQVVARFEQERQALALMDHPNIARVIDAGATATGRPYFVMELVKGEPISEYCDKHHLTIDERLALFEQVCRAVQHAHSKGIIHRDLKPSNILVGTSDGKPLAKVIDFGIAKATSAKLTDKTLFTEHQQVIGTLQYMSPEQAEGSLDIDTRTDVYALGVVLYELLTGSPPFDHQTMRDALFSEMKRIIREVDPPKPSTRLHQSADMLATIAARRKVEPRRLGTLVRGELDWIVMKALAKERTRRYESAHGLAEDLRRYVAGEAVVAAPPSAVYRFRKVVARNRGLVLGGSAVALALLIGAIAFAWQASVARTQRDHALVAQRAEAEQRRIADEQRTEALRLQSVAEANAAAEAKARKRAETTSAFVTSALKSADPNYGGEQSITVAEAMQQAVKLLDEGSVRDEPDLEAHLRSLIAEILHRNGRISDALPLAERSLALYTQLAPPEGSRDVAIATNQVATIQQDLGHFDVAEPLFVRALEMLRVSDRGDTNELSMALNNLGLVRAYRGRFAEAEPLFVESLEMKQRLFPGDNEDVAMGFNNLANIFSNLQRNDEALVMFERSLAMYDRLFDAHPQLAMALYNLGQQYISTGRLKDAADLIDRALAMYRRLFQGDHADVARAISGVGNIRRIQGRFVEAETYFNEALAMKQRLFPGDHPAVASELSILARTQLDGGDAASAEITATNALEMQRRLHPEHPDVARALDLLATVKRASDKNAESEQLLAEALDLQRTLHGGDHADVARAMNRLAGARAVLGRAEEADALSQDAVAMWKRVIPADHPLVAAALVTRGLALMKLAKPADAEPAFREGVEMARRVYGGDHYDVATALGHLANCLHELGRTDEERAVYDESIAMHRRRTPDGSADLASMLWLAADARMKDGDAAGARDWLEEVVRFAERTYAPDSTVLAKYKASLEKCRAASAR
jgi:serine/threonine protein kinase